MKSQILVIGYSAEHCTAKAYDLACEVGREIARNDAMLITGGLGGVMEAASKGAHEAGGLVISIVPQDEKLWANKYSDVIIPTGIGISRDFITVYSADGVIIVGGGAGTMIEACVAYLKSKPMVALRESGGVADKLAGTYIDERKIIRIIGVDKPKEAVKQLLNIFNSIKRS